MEQSNIILIAIICAIVGGIFAVYSSKRKIEYVKNSSAQIKNYIKTGGWGGSRIIQVEYYCEEFQISRVQTVTKDFADQYSIDSTIEVKIFKVSEKKYDMSIDYDKLDYHN